MPRLQVKRGLKANLPTSGMVAGEPHITTDRGTLHVALDATTNLPVVPPLEDLTAMGAVDNANDLLLIHDASEGAAQKEKKITFASLKTALNIGGVSWPLEVDALSDPSATSKLQLYAKEIAGRTMLKGLQPSGRDYPYQAALFQNAIWMVSPNTTTSVTTLGGAVTSTGTLSTTIPATVGATVFPFMTNFASAASVNGTAGTGMKDTQIRHSQASGAVGGFFFQGRIGFPDASYASAGVATGWRFFFGVTSGTLASMINTSSPTGDFAGLHLIDDGTNTETSFHIATRNNTTTTRTDTTMVFTARNVYDFYLFSKVADSSTIWWRIDNLTNNTTVEGSVTDTLPRTSVNLRAGFQLGTVPATARNIRMSRLYCESDY